MEAPRITQELIDYLDHQFPNQCPRITFTDRQIWVSAGSAEVVKHLIRVKEDQEENILYNR